MLAHIWCSDQATEEGVSVTCLLEAVCNVQHLLDNKAQPLSYEWYKMILMPIIFESLVSEHLWKINIP